MGNRHHGRHRNRRSVLRDWTSRCRTLATERAVKDHATVHEHAHRFPIRGDIDAAINESITVANSSTINNASTNDHEVVNQASHRTAESTRHEGSRSAHGAPRRLLLRRWRTGCHVCRDSDGVQDISNRQPAPVATRLISPCAAFGLASGRNHPLSADFDVLAVELQLR